MKDLFKLPMNLQFLLNLVKETLIQILMMGMKVASRIHHKKKESSPVRKWPELSLQR